MNANTTNHPACREDAPARPTVKPFKSARAAKMAYTKAEKAYDAARAAANNQRHEFGKDGWNEERFAVIGAMEAEYGKLFEAMRAVYTQATAQGFYVDSWHFGHNPTRDIIAANMD